MVENSQNQALIKLITGRQQKLENDKTAFNDRLQDVADLVCPHRDDILGNRLPGEKKGSKIFDGTAVAAAILAADGIHGYHVSPAFPWFKYMMNRKEVNKVPQIKLWLEEIEFNMYMALNRSNFYSEMWSYIYDGFTLGTAPIYPEEDLVNGRIIFESVHPGEAYIAENKFGEVDILHRKRKIAARKLVQMFGKDSCPESVKQAYENNPFCEFEVIHAVFPREEFDTRKMDGRNKRFASVWLLSAGNHLLRVSGMDQFGYMVWRYMRTGKDPYGVSPAHLAMSDIKAINLMGKTLLGAAQLAVDPAYNVPAYLEGKVQLKPRGLNYTKDGDHITPVNTGVNFPVGIDREQAKQRSIKERFHVDTFLMLANLEGRGQRTAYEVSQMMSEKAAVLGAELGPLNTELDHILDRVYDIESAAGRMPHPPDILLGMADKDPHLRFDPVYMGPLAQAQKERFQKDGLAKFFIDLAPIAQVFPDALDNIDSDATLRLMAENNSVPNEILKSKDAVEAVRQGRRQAQQSQTIKDSLGQVAPAVKDLASADATTGGNLSALIGNMAHA
jgi:hypothetical protein